jgi:hypothetical protein
MKTKRSYALTKQFLRGNVSKAASYTEIFIIGIVLIGVVLLGYNILRDIYHIISDIIYGTKTITVTIFLQDAFELIIGIEFIKMVAKHTPSSAVEVILYAVARQLINTHSSSIDSLIGVVAIALLFAIRKYLGETIHVSKQNEYIVEGSMCIDELNSKLKTHFDRTLGNSVGGIIFNHATKEEGVLVEGYSMSIDGYTFEVYSMDKDVILKVKLTQLTP